MIDQIYRLLEPLKRRINLMLARAVVKAINDSGAIQTMQLDILADETREGVERFQDYGMTSHPPKGSEVVVAFVGGNRAHGLILKVDNREYRIQGLEEGELALYSDEGDYIWFKRNREIHVRTDKWKLQGSSDELMDLLISVTTELKLVAAKLALDTTNTILGPMQLNGFSYYAARQAAVEALILKLEGITAD